MTPNLEAVEVHRAPSRKINFNALIVEGRALVALIIIITFFSLTSKHFLQPENLILMTRHVAMNAILAIGMLLVILNGGIDLSVGSTVGVSGVVAGYLLKGASTERVIDAIREVHAGGSVIQPNLARALLKHFKLPEGIEAEPSPSALLPGNRMEPPMAPLTAREVEVLRLVAKGLSNLEAAQVLGLSRSTVRTHIEHIFQKLEVSNRVEAVTEGLRKGLIET